jgi:hypothetical protein
MVAAQGMDQVGLQPEEAMFAGRAARNAPHQLLDAVEQIFKYHGGKTPEPIDRKIWEQQGAGVNREGHPFFEIDDSAAQYVPPPSSGAPQRSDYGDVMDYLKAKQDWQAAGGVEAPKSYKMSDVLTHPELYANYPQLGELPVLPQQNMGDVRGVMHFGINGPMKVEYDAQRSPDTIKQTLLHELQHGVQSIEGWTKGSNLYDAESFVGQANRDLQTMHDIQAIRDYLDMGVSPDGIKAMAAQGHLNSATDELINHARKLTPQQIEEGLQAAQVNKKTYGPRPFDVYERNEGEFQARNTARRSDYAPEDRRWNYWKDTEDRPGEPHIDGFGSVLPE